MANSPFVGFARRLTRGYVVLAISLIVLVGSATTTMGFVLYAGSLNDTVSASGARARQLYDAGHRHADIQTLAPTLVKSLVRPRLKIGVYDNQHNVLAGSDDQPSRIAGAVAALLGIHNAVIHESDGEIIVRPDIDGFMHLLGGYWAINVPVGLLAVLVAWFVGRRITGSAIEPLADVTRALRRIADGDFAPAPLLHHSSELRDLTSAYDDVAYRLSAATAERLRYETEMRQFIADAGHELRTPLTIVMGYLEALQGGVVRDADGIARVYETMQGESRRMRTVIEKLIFLARLEKAVRTTCESIDLTTVTQRAIDALQPLGGERISFDRDGEVAIDADEAELYEAIKNIIENGLKYAPQSSVVVTVRREATGATLAIGDRGPGMSELDVAHAFDRFYRGEARTTAEGSGLGLAIAKRAVERIGGTIAIESKPGDGTTVIMRFA